MAGLGASSYDAHAFGAAWWAPRAADPAHRRAYRAIVDELAGYVPAVPERIVDYACGTGLLLRALARRFPRAALHGIDESRRCLAAADEVLARARLPLATRGRLRLSHACLPDFDLGCERADLACFTFPDFRTTSAPAFVRRWRERFHEDWAAAGIVARQLARLDPAAAVDRAGLFVKRVAHRNLRALVRRGGTIVRVDYANADRDQCDPAAIAAMTFEEGSGLPGLAHLDANFRRRLRFSRLIGQSYHRSRVMADVHAQTGDPDDRVGGFLVSVLEAL